MSDSITASFLDAIREGNFDEVKKSIDEISDLDAQDENGRTALMTAVQHDQSRIIRLLVKKGANVNVQDNHGNTAVIYAVSFYYEWIAAYLIEHGADLTIGNKEGKFVYSRETGKARLIVLKKRFLSEKDEDIRRQRGEDALKFALETNNPKEALFFFNQGISLRPAINDLPNQLAVFTKLAELFN